jgi:hypothetical protein
MNRKGQATTELAIILPLFVLLAGGLLSVGYICWQGLKVQEAANLAARIQGEERVGGGVSADSIQQDNGLDGSGDRVPDDSLIGGLSKNPDALSGMKSKPTGGVYGKIYKAVHQMFTKGEQEKLFVPPPIKQGINSDTVQVVRVLNPPKFLDFKLAPIRLEAEAYGGEDSHMYGLPRWGRTADSPGQFYTTNIKNPDNK